MGLTLTDAKKRILAQLAAEPAHGYQLAQDLQVRGSTMYEHLEALEAHGYVTSYQDERRRIYSLTQKGELIVQAEGLEDEI